MKTIFCDIDGTLIKHFPPTDTCTDKFIPELLPGVKDKIKDWIKNNYTIVLVTGRKESQRSVTEKQLRMCGIPFDHLIMGLSNGPRIIINDQKNDGQTTAYSVSIPRNEGLLNVTL